MVSLIFRGQGKESTGTWAKKAKLLQARAGENTPGVVGVSKQRVSPAGCVGWYSGRISQ